MRPVSILLHCTALHRSLRSPLASPGRDAAVSYSGGHSQGIRAMNFNRLPVVLLNLSLALTACNTPNAASPATTPEAKPAGTVGLANPASVHCEKLGGKLEIRTGKDGGQYGLCKLPDGRVCEEWGLFRDGKCDKPAE